MGGAMSALLWMNPLISQGGFLFVFDEINRKLLAPTIIIFVQKASSTTGSVEEAVQGHYAQP
ncbi:hypothetical protein VSK91_22365 [Bacillus swezeyi]|uniref:hypothetical protein n=1 Tax=Bacillus swezeyi TaxID=1925020 RepID=UPI0039C6EE0B